jgi:RNA polymerase sigma-70 factor (ECF subfamily)
MEQMHYAEVAAQLRIPIGTVMSRLFRARERMRVLLADTTRPTLRRVK